MEVLEERLAEGDQGGDGMISQEELQAFGYRSMEDIPAVVTIPATFTREAYAALIREYGVRAAVGNAMPMPDLTATLTVEALMASHMERRLGTAPTIVSRPLPPRKHRKKAGETNA